MKADVMVHRATDLGRGEVATLDMKRRIAALRAAKADVLSALWERHLRAEAGDGYRYEYAGEGAVEALPGD